MAKRKDPTEHATRYKIIGEYVNKKTGKQLTGPGDGVIRRHPRARIVKHRPQDKGVVYVILSPPAGKRHLTGDDSHGCPRCYPRIAPAVDQRKVPQ